ncbi:MAG: amino acid ABC transporter permease [Armatimonadota bacterium]|nr:amino acid ABC transporter permease [Armatimonadota bacterium]MDR7611762.1 amino acid ABC transporter permease [Armatimonadota bacterium]
MSRFEFHWDAVLQRWDWLATGLLMNVYISASSMILALVIGLVIAVLRMAPLPLVPLAAQIYINVFRAIPLFVFIIWLYYGLPILLGINFPPVTAGVICLSMQYAGWLAEIYRAGIGAIPRGQREAALSLGLTPLQAFRDVIFPQALRIIIPPIGNNFVGMLKDSSLVSIIGVFELVRQANLAVSLTFRPFEFYTVVAVIYIILTQALSHGVTRLERRMRI